MVNNRYLWFWRLEEWETLIFMVLEVGGVGDTNIYGAGGWRSGRH